MVKMRLEKTTSSVCASLNGITADVVYTSTDMINSIIAVVSVNLLPLENTMIHRITVTANTPTCLMTTGYSENQRRVRVRMCCTIIIAPSTAFLMAMSWSASCSGRASRCRSTYDFMEDCASPIHTIANTVKNYR